MARNKTIRIKKIEVYVCLNSRSKQLLRTKPEPDMLRYDSCYTSDTFPYFVVFINRTIPITTRRWDSFWQKLDYLGTVAFIDFEKWFSYSGDIGRYAHDRSKGRLSMKQGIVNSEWDSSARKDYEDGKINLVLDHRTQKWNFETIDEIAEMVAGYKTDEIEEECDVCGTFVGKCNCESGRQ